MKRWLQEFGFKKSSYERPNQTWVCGHTCLGQGCPAGPDKQGTCRAAAECEPVRNGDRWHCTRPAGMGGACAEGPLPDGRCCRQVPKCTPTRTLRSWRGLAVLLAIGLSLATVLLIFGRNEGAAVVSPGDLSFAHASAQSKCSDCHAGAEREPIAWLVQSAHSPSAREDNRLCLRCHEVGAESGGAHSLPAAQLTALTAAAKTRRGKAGSIPVSMVVSTAIAGRTLDAGGELACASCHKEHRGEFNDLKVLANRQCQSCHYQPFDSFASDHPPFTTFPFQRRTRIIFDHNSHLQKHFHDPGVDKAAPVSCMDCHQSDLAGGTMIVKPFEQTCAACHVDQIKGKGAVKTGIAFISLPKFDDRTLTGGYGIGEWPEDAEQPLTPFMRFLLSADADTRVALDKLGTADLSNLPKAETEKLRAAQTLAWGIKGLIYDLGNQGQDELLRRLALALGRSLNNREKESLARMISSDTVRTAFQSSFPHLQAEIIAYREQKKTADTELTPSPPLAKKSAVKVATPDGWVSNGGWYSPDASFTLYYRPAGHADNFLYAWMDLTADAKKTPNPSAARALFNELSSNKAPGFCAKCHSIDAQRKEMVNWHPARTDNLEHGFNRFSHSAHLSLLDNTGCMTCHALQADNGKETYMGAFDAGKHDPSKFHSNFRVVNKETCASCHRPGFASDNCLHCHNYHVGHYNPVLPEAVGAIRSRTGKSAQAAPRK